MKRLSFDEIRPAVRGCHDTAIAGGRLQFRRMPQAMAVAHRASEPRTIRVQNTCGVRLSFRSPTRNLRLSLAYSCMSRPHWDGAVTIDGRRVATFGPGGEAPGWQGSIELPEHEPSAVVEVWLPHQVRADLERLEIDDGCDFAPAPPPAVRWLALGDSITQGMVTPLPDEACVSVAARELGVDFRNYGIGGAQLEAFLAETDFGFDAHLVTVAFGGNDFNHSVPPQQYAANGAALVSSLLARYARTRVIVITPTVWLGRDRNEGGYTLEDYRAALRKAFASPDSRVTLINGLDMVPPEPSLFVDGVHPNTAGMAAYGLAIAPILRRCLTAR